MNYFTRYHRHLSLCLGLLLGSASMCATASADSRQDAIQAASALYQAGTAQRYPDEMRSLDATLSTAESYFRSNDTSNAERYYLMTIQKARVIESLHGHDGATPAAAPAAAEPPAAAPAPVTAAKQAEPPQPFSNSSTAASDARPDALEQDEIVSDRLIGKASTYTVVKGDTLRLVAAKLGVSRQHLIRMNSLDAKATLKAGQSLKYNNRKIIPQRVREGIIVNIPDRTLYYFQKGKLVKSLPVALGTSTKNEKYDWQTPTGKFKIVAKQKDPTWYVPPSIQSEMEEGGKEVIISIPPGPDNPLGKYAIKTSIPGILIHSTTKPWSIYSFASHGCIRVYPDHMEEFFKEVRVNTPGEIIYKPVKLAVTEEGRIFLEVHNDVYGKNIVLAAEARKLVEKSRLGERIDWKKFNHVLKQKSGIAEDISL